MDAPFRPSQINDGGLRISCGRSDFIGAISSESTAALTEGRSSGAAQLLALV